MSPPPRIDLRPGISSPVLLVISRRQVEEADIASVLSEVKPFLATGEDAWLYRGQMVLSVDGYNDDPRELVDIAEVRALLCELERQWPYWAFFFNQVDDSIKLLASCVCGTDFPGRGVVEIDARMLGPFLDRAFDGMNAIFDMHGFPEGELESMSRGLVEVLEQAGMM